MDLFIMKIYLFSSAVHNDCTKMRKPKKKLKKKDIGNLWRRTFMNTIKCSQYNVMIETSIESSAEHHIVAVCQILHIACHQSILYATTV